MRNTLGRALAAIGVGFSAIGIIVAASIGSHAVQQSPGVTYTCADVHISPVGGAGQASGCVASKAAQKSLGKINSQFRIVQSDESLTLVCTADDASDIAAGGDSTTESAGSVVAAPPMLPLSVVGTRCSADS